MARARSYTGNFGGVQGRFDVNLSVDNREFVEMCERLKYDEMVRTSDVRKVFAKVAKPVRQTVQQGARAAMKSDPRKAWKGVRVITLKGGKGVVVGLLNPRKAGKATGYTKPKGGRSGIIRNRDRSRRTIALEGYQGADRSFILRMLNQGTEQRTANVYPNDLSRRSTANRGRLTAKKFFDRAEPAMKQASQSLATELRKIIKKRSKKS